MNVTSSYQNSILDAAIGTTTYNKGATLHVALHTGDPGTTGASNELTVGSNGYARATLANTTAGVAAASGGAKANVAAVSFPTATGSWGTVTHWSIKDAASGGNTLFYGSLAASKAIGAGDSFAIAIGALTFTFA